MPKWNKLVITDQGAQLSAQTLSGKKIQYTHVLTTNKDMSSMTSDDQKALVKLDDVVQDVPVGTVTVQDDHTVNIPVRIANADVEQDYQLFGLVLYAKLADEVSPEIIYGVLTASVPELIPAGEKGGGTNIFGTNFTLKVHVGSAEQVQIVVTPDGSVSNAELDAKLKDYPTADEVEKIIESTIPPLPSNLAKTDISNKFSEIQYGFDGSQLPTYKQMGLELGKYAKTDDLSNYIKTADTSGWQKFSLTDANGFVLVRSGTSLGTIKQTGFYRVTNPSDVPTGVKDVMLAVITDTSWVIKQIAYGITTEDMYTRTFNHNIWSKWKNQLSASNLSDYADTFSSLDFNLFIVGGAYSFTGTTLANSPIASGYTLKQSVSGTISVEVVQDKDGNTSKVVQHLMIDNSSNAVPVNGEKFIVANRTGTILSSTVTIVWNDWSLENPFIVTTNEDALTISQALPSAMVYVKEAE